METKRLGRTGLKVSAMCLGTMTFGNQAGEDTSFAIMDKAWEAGIFFFDSADVYPVIPTLETVGRSEEIIGRWVKARGVRYQLVLATKARGRMGPGPNDQGLSRRHLMEAIDASLRRLGTDYVDLYQVHSPDPETPLEETMRALDDIVRSGKARYVGCSNFEAWRLCKSLWVSDKHGLARFDSAQPRYNLLDRRIEPELLPLCREEGTGVIPYSPLGGGLLTGKYRRGQAPPSEARYVRFGRQAMLTDPTLDAVAQLEGIARERGITPAQLALGWLLANPVITAPIIGATHPEQLDETLAAQPIDLTEAERAACDAAWAQVQPEVR
jgi:aryl-alcohol dehydrogenase-like predicted oxidoreductase